MDGQSPYEIIVSRLSGFLGPHTARVALRTFWIGIGNGAPETIESEDVPKLLAALHPMLRTLIGRESADGLVRELGKELE